MMARRLRREEREPGIGWIAHDNCHRWYTVHSRQRKGRAPRALQRVPPGSAVLPLPSRRLDGRAVRMGVRIFEGYCPEGCSIPSIGTRARRSGEGDGQKPSRGAISALCPPTRSSKNQLKDWVVCRNGPPRSSVMGFWAMATGTMEGGPNVNQHLITVARADVRSHRAGAVTETPLFKVVAGA